MAASRPPVEWRHRMGPISLWSQQPQCWRRQCWSGIVRCLQLGWPARRLCILPCSKHMHHYVPDYALGLVGITLGRVNTARNLSPKRARLTTNTALVKCFTRTRVSQQYVAHCSIYIVMFFFFTSPQENVRNIATSSSVCLSVRSHNSKHTDDFHQIICMLL